MRGYPDEHNHTWHLYGRGPGRKKAAGELAVLPGAKALRKNISQLHGGLNEGRGKDRAGHTIAQLIRMAQNVLGLLERNRIRREIKGSLTIEV